MKINLILKILAFILFLLFMGMFIFENLDPVRIWIPFFKGRQFGLIYIIGITYVIGLSNMFWVMVHFGARMKRKQQAVEAEEDDGELFEDEA
ncbi:MAG: hypothetical protein HQL22_06350 [Candidatus Omnitrophica bacterium]|nr:hypothetical protein [Candidatus Omnitrophota bacterium]